MNKKCALVLLVAFAVILQLNGDIVTVDESTDLPVMLKSFSEYKPANKRVPYVPFRWGKRSPHYIAKSESDLEEICIDLFDSTVKNEKFYERKILSDPKYQKLLLKCFKFTSMYLLNKQEARQSADTESNPTYDDHPDTADLPHGEMAISFVKNKISLKENANAHLLKRNNIPFRWG